MSGNDEITTWLDGIGLAQYSTVFAENAIDLDILPDVTEADQSICYQMARRGHLAAITSTNFVLQPGFETSGWAYSGSQL